MKPKLQLLFVVLFVLFSCKQSGEKTARFSGNDGEVKLTQLNPEYGHAIATQSEDLKQLDLTVYVYTPDVLSISEYLERTNETKQP